MIVRKKCLKDTVGSCTYELTAVVTECPRFAETKISA